MFDPIDLIRRVRSGNPEIEVCRAAHVDDLEEFVCRGDYQVPSQDIVAALLRDATLRRQYSPHLQCVGR